MRFLHLRRNQYNSNKRATNAATPIPIPAFLDAERPDLAFLTGYGIEKRTLLAVVVCVIGEPETVTVRVSGSGGGTVVVGSVL